MKNEVQLTMYAENTCSTVMIMCYIVFVSEQITGSFALIAFLNHYTCILHGRIKV